MGNIGYSRLNHYYKSQRGHPYFKSLFTALLNAAKMLSQREPSSALDVLYDRKVDGSHNDDRRFPRQTDLPHK